jgi:hypothetical protein
MRSFTFWRAVLLLSVLGCASSGCRQAIPVSTTAADGPNKNTNQVAVDQGDLKFRYQPPQPTSTSQTPRARSNPQAVEKLIAELNQRLILPFDIEVRLEDCEQPDAYYDPETHQIFLCYQLIDEYYVLFAKKIKDKTKLDDAVTAATAATFFHELGHGLVDAWKVPITGREEDAVDQLSTLVLIEATEGGEQMALDGALAFKLYAELANGEKKIYWDEHSLDEQRFFDTICLVYGHDDEKFAYLVDNGTLPEERASLCREDYSRVKGAWQQLLGPYLKPAQSRPKLKLRS